MRNARLTKQLLRCVALMPLLAVAACAGSQRFDGAPRSPVAGGPVYNAPSPGPAPAISSGAVTSQPLPPPQGSMSPTVEAPIASAPVGSSLPPPQDAFFTPTPQPQPPAQPTQPQTLGGGGGRIATLGEGASTGRSGPVRSRDGVIGSWNAREATGGSCKVQLSSSPTLDLYRANAAGCTNKDLQKVSAWDYRDGEVYLYQPGGGVVARLRPTDGTAMSGAVAKSGANLSMSR
ncbi:MAG: AprI/Inh family metalloprotease inhibitor [Bosea sp. (in: a-proteobacteria)]